MKLSEQGKPISYLKAHAPEVIRQLADNRQPVVITLHGKAKAVLQDVTQYEETLALTNKQVEDGKVRPARETFARLRARLAKPEA